EAQVDAYVANNGYLTAEVDGSTTNELQNLTFASNVIGLTSSGVTFDLSAYLDNTDAQDLTLSGNTLSLTGDGTSVDLSSYLDDTDSQSISVASNILSISGNASTVDLSAYLDNTDVLAGLSCSIGEVPKWNGSSWACATDNSGGGGFSFSITDGTNTQGIADTDTINFS
ncbi:hypothetical protein KC992_05105, partial [Candidatus Saccharibacteria bacterium]|nr:hypothetical protein [Candidatus Saccharibacteria bacterium]